MRYLKEENHAQFHSLGSTALNRGTLRWPGASQVDLAGLENRLRRPVPPSYAAFLRETDGWIQIGLDVADGLLLPAAQVDRFAVRHPDSLNNWIHGATLPGGGFVDVSDEDYFSYGDLQDPAKLRMEYLKDSVAIGEEVQSSIYLLNPKVVSPDGEWEAWLLGTHLPGALRYPSFWEMMVAEKRRISRDLPLA